jgi:hypothetical protein
MLSARLTNATPSLKLLQQLDQVRQVPPEPIEAPRDAQAAAD